MQHITLRLASLQDLHWTGQWSFPTLYFYIGCAKFAFWLGDGLSWGSLWFLSVHL